MYFKFNNEDSRDYGITVLTQPMIMTPQHRTWTTFIDGYDGARSSHLGFHPYSMEFEIAVEGEGNINKIMQWLQGEGKFVRSDFPDRYINVHIDLGIQFERKTEWLYVATVSMWAYDPFWYKLEDDWEGPFRKTLVEGGWNSFKVQDLSSFKGATKAPEEIYRDGYKRNYFIGTKRFEGFNIKGVNGAPQSPIVRGEELIFKFKKGQELELKPSFSKEMVLERGRKYTLSFDIKSSKKSEINVEWYPYSEYEEWTEEVGTEWKRLNLEYIHKGPTEVNPRNEKVFKITNVPEEVEFRVRHLKLNVGDGMYWTEAWEDFSERQRTETVTNGASRRIRVNEEGMYEIKVYGDVGIVMWIEEDGEMTLEIDNKGETITLVNTSLEKIEVPSGEYKVVTIPTFRNLKMIVEEGNMRFISGEPVIVKTVSNINYDKEKGLKPFSDNKNLIEGGP